MHTPIIELARDPRFVPYIYDYCDQWCRYCPMTSRCLLYAVSTSKGRQPALPRNANEMFASALALSRAIAEATGTAVAELDVRLCDPAAGPAAPVIGDPLERLGRTYALQAAQYVMSCGGTNKEPASGPEATPLTVLVWFHLKIAAKIYRALVSAYRAANGTPALADDARGCAKLVLVGIDRSRGALEQLSREERGGSQGASSVVREPDARIAHLIALLDVLEASVEQRFPDARAFVRPGLDSTPAGGH